MKQLLVEDILPILDDLVGDVYGTDLVHDYHVRLSGPEILVNKIFEEELKPILTSEVNHLAVNSNRGTFILCLKSVNFVNILELATNYKTSVDITDHIEEI